VPICNYCWGSHGCELPKGDHTTHQCSIPMTDDDGMFSVVMCCEYDEKADPDRRVRHNHASDDEPTEWGEWGPYGEGWRVW
jgi:hypothetical protein